MCRLHRAVAFSDDNVDSADSLAMTLEFWDCTARTAYNGADALQVVEEFRPHVVLLDIGMPEMDGYEVARRIRNMPQGKETLLIALTGWGQEEHRRRTAEAGFDEHVTKPVDHTQLMQLVRHDI